MACTTAQTDRRPCGKLHCTHRTELRLCLSPSIVGRLLCPLVCRPPAACQGPDVLLPVPTYDRQPAATCPCVSCCPPVPVPAPPPSVRRRFTLPREARGLFPENGSQIERNFQGTNRGPGLNRVAVLRLMGD